MKIKNILTRSYPCLLFVFLALYAILIRLSANEKTIIYCVSLMVGAIIVVVIAFLLNHCRKKQARILYLLTICLISSFVIIQAIYYLVVKYIFIDDIDLYQRTNNLYIWLLRIFQAFFITSGLLTTYFIFKDYLKKDYRFDIYDFQIIQMFINILCYIAIIYIHFDYAGYTITEKIDPITYQSIGKNIEFINDNIATYGTLIVIGLYIIQFFIIEIIKNKTNNK